jgi:hypothetical protein
MRGSGKEGTTCKCTPVNGLEASSWSDALLLGYLFLRSLSSAFTLWRKLRCAATVTFQSYPANGREANDYNKKSTDGNGALLPSARVPLGKADERGDAQSG